MEEQKAQFQLIAAGIVGFVGVVAAGAFLLLSGGAKAPSSSDTAAIPRGLSTPPPSRSLRVGAPAGRATPAVASSTARLLPDESRSAAGAAGLPSRVAASAGSSAPAAPDAAAEPHLVATPHLDVSSSAHSSARVSVASARKARGAPAAPQAQTEVDAAPKAAAVKFNSRAVASIHYGVSDRSQLMGNAAGPVYNFAGVTTAKNAAALGRIAGQDVAQELRDQLGGANLSPEDRARLQKALENAENGAPSGDPSTASAAAQ
jgi:hypothetical protein